jgi:alpha-L-arabinofuranosidase
VCGAEFVVLHDGSRAAENFGTYHSLATSPEGIGRITGPPEPNLVGTDELLQYCLDVDAEPFLIASLGTGTAEEAAEWVRYCNVGRTAPRTVTWWGIGNETWAGLHEYDTPRLQSTVRASSSWPRRCKPWTHRSSSWRSGSRSP